MQRNEQMNTGYAKEAIGEAAAHWLVALKSPDLSPAMFNRWEKWVAVPAHRQAFDEAQELWKLMDELQPMQPSDAEVAADTYDASTPVWVFEEKQQSVRHRQRRERRFKAAWMSLAAAVGTVAVGLGIFKIAIGPIEHRSAGVTLYATEPAQHESVVLSDGSEIQMGARTAVTANVTRDNRLVVLDRGEALFQVAHDPKRPFRVLAGAGVITAVGTAFNVRRLDGMVVVTVTEGTVEVAPAKTVNARTGSEFPHGQRVTHGEAISYDAEGRLSDVRTVDPKMATAWRDGRLQYLREPLNRVVQDINRYSRTVVSIEDAATGDIVYSGTVFERDINDWLGALETAFPEIEVIHRDQDVLLRKRPDKSPAL